MEIAWDSIDKVEGTPQKIDNKVSMHSDHQTKHWGILRLRGRASCGNLRTIIETPKFGQRG